MGKRKTKYTMRADGRIVLSETINGKRKYFYGSSDSEVEQKCRDYKAALAAAPRCRTFEQVADDYWEDKQSEISPNSFSGYHTIVERTKDEFGKELVDEITPQEVYTFLKKLAVKGYSQKVITNTKAVTKGIFDNAFIAGEISLNPCSGLPPVKGKPAQPRKRADAADMTAVDDHRFDSNISRLFFFILYTGLRRGEAVALQYKHIDKKKKTCRVEQSCAWQNSKPVLKMPKTASGVRVVDLVDAALEVIPDGHDPEEYVFFPDGLPHKSFLERRLKEFQAAAGLTSMPHAFRHSFASMGHTAGIDPKDMQHELGHSSIKMTMDIYTDLEQQQREKVRKKLNKHVQAQRKKR